MTAFVRPTFIKRRVKIFYLQLASNLIYEENEEEKERRRRRRREIERERERKKKKKRVQA